MEVDDLGNLCLGCMQDKGDAVACPKCGYRLDEKRSPLVLPYQSVLNNKFLVGRILGKPGGFGVTYLAWDLILQTAVAVKEYLPRDLVSRDANKLTVVPHSREEGEEFAYGLSQFLREARTLARFNHPNVVRVRDFFEQNQTAYLVMDYYEGISLDQYLSRNGGRLDEAVALAFMQPVLDGLSEVHAKGFLHRDIKPSNIYLTKAGTPILLDFGAARLALQGHRSRPLSVILTPGFAPFEQYLPKREFGPEVDIYACGATLYYLVTGEKPQEATARYKHDEMMPPDQKVPGLTPRFSQAVMQALALEPEQRPRTVEAFRALLRAPEEPARSTGTGLAAGTGAVAESGADSARSRTRDPGPPGQESEAGSRRRPAVPPAGRRISGLGLGLGILGAAGLLVAGFLLIPRADRAPPPGSPPAAETPSQAPVPLPEEPDRPLRPEGPPGERRGMGEAHPPYPPPRQAIDLCQGKPRGAACELRVPHGLEQGTCEQIVDYFACRPLHLPPGQGE
jgi:serine/threonine protein kinase